jgi:hypothetical protein
MTLEEKLDSKQAIALSVYGMLESAMKLSKNNFINSQPTYLILQDDILFGHFACIIDNASLYCSLCRPSLVHFACKVMAGKVSKCEVQS